MLAVEGKAAFQYRQAQQDAKCREQQAFIAEYLCEVGPGQAAGAEHDLQEMGSSHYEKIFHKSKEIESKMRVRLEQAVRKYQKMKLAYKKLNKCVLLLKQKGFPVDNVIQNELNPQNIEQLWLEVPSYQETSICSESIDTNSGQKEPDSLDFNGISPIVSKKESPHF